MFAAKGKDEVQFEPLGEEEQETSHEEQDTSLQLKEIELQDSPEPAQTSDYGQLKEQKSVIALPSLWAKPDDIVEYINTNPTSITHFARAEQIIMALTIAAENKDEENVSDCMDTLVELLNNPNSTISTSQKAFLLGKTLIVGKHMGYKDEELGYQKEIEDALAQSGSPDQYTAWAQACLAVVPSEYKAMQSVMEKSADELERIRNKVKDDKRKSVEERHIAKANLVKMYVLMALAAAENRDRPSFDKYKHKLKAILGASRLTSVSTVLGKHLKNLYGDQPSLYTAWMVHAMCTIGNPDEPKDAIRCNTYQDECKNAVSVTEKALYPLLKSFERNGKVIDAEKYISLQAEVVLAKLITTRAIAKWESLYFSPARVAAYEKAKAVFVPFM